MTEYFVRNLTPRSWQIAKFEDGSKEPSEIYKVTDYPSQDRMHCDCLGFRRATDEYTHKHIVMVLGNIESGYNYFDENFVGKKVFE